MRYLVVAERIVKSMRGLASASLLPSHYLYSVCHTLSRGFLKLAFKLALGGSNHKGMSNTPFI